MIGYPAQFKKIALPFLLLILALFWGRPAPVQAAANDDDTNRPERLITMAAEYPGVQVPMGEDVEMDLIFHNKGRTDENVAVWIEKLPENWSARIKTYRYTVSKVHVAAGEDKTLTLELKPDDKVQAGDYAFEVAAKTTDGKFTMNQPVSVALTAEQPKTRAQGVKITTSYPVLRGPSDGKFEFSLEVESQLDEDGVFDLSAKGPEGWDINFKPAYEDKFISSLRLKKSQSSTVAVEVKPEVNAGEGEFPVNIRISRGAAKGEAELKIVLTGTYDLAVKTTTGLLSLDARQGKPAVVSFYVENTGSAVNKDISFMSFAPENWKVDFNPESIQALEPGKMAQVEMTMTPAAEALVGDYSVGVTVNGEKATQDLEFRVTVKASATWGWIGIGIILAVVAGLTFLFRKLGRR